MFIAQKYRAFRKQQRVDVWVTALILATMNSNLLPPSQSLKMMTLKY
jgi:hypothetical protein